MTRLQYEKEEINGNLGKISPNRIIGFEINAEYMSIINKKIKVTPNMFYL